jgi:hypothetical protein
LLRLLVDEIRVEGKRVVTKGGHHSIAGIIARKKVDPQKGCPQLSLTGSA